MHPLVDLTVAETQVPTTKGTPLVGKATPPAVVHTTLPPPTVTRMTARHTLALLQGGGTREPMRPQRTAVDTHTRMVHGELIGLT